jgi:hypothetical protein
MLRPLLIAIAVGIGCAGGGSTPAPQAAQPLAASEEALDKVRLVDGQIVYGRVLHEGSDSVVVGQPNGTFTLKPSEVASVEKHAGQRMRPVVAKGQRLPSFAVVMDAAARKPWIGELHQIPATVIGIGYLREIPYISHRAGDIELNVYGDPSQPAAVEVGIYKADVDEATRRQLRDFIVEVLANDDDRATASKLSLDDDDATRDGLTFDIDPPTSADSFGAWWFTVYDNSALDRARAPAQELQQITTAATSQSNVGGWTATDSSYASPRSSSSGNSGGGARVYVRGYTRKDGTYVSPHTRSAPHSRRR